jgi:hypothetical protein
MSCTGRHAVSYVVARPGDRITVWLENCSPSYFVTGHMSVAPAPGAVQVGEHQLTQAAPLAHVYSAGEAFLVTVAFDPRPGTTGKSAEVHGRVTGPDGTVRKEWCTRIESGNSKPDWAAFGVKGRVR